MALVTLGRGDLRAMVTLGFSYTVVTFWQVTLGFSYGSGEIRAVVTWPW